MKKTFQYKSEVQSIVSIRKDLEILADTWEIPSSESRQITLIVEELFSNIIRFAFEGKGNHLIELSLSKSEGIISLLLSDDGIQFNPLEYNPGQEADPAFIDDGGMGLTLIKAFADSIEYKREKQKNQLHIIKSIRSQSGSEQS